MAGQDFGYQIVAVRRYIEIRLPELGRTVIGAIVEVLEPLMGRAGAPLLEAGHLHHIVENGAQRIGRFRVGRLQASPESGITVAVTSREGSPVAQSPPALAHIENIRAHIVLPATPILPGMGTQVVIAGGRRSGTTPLRSRIDEAQTATELMTVRSLTATDLLQFHHRFPGHLADATRIRLKQHALDVATERKGYVCIYGHKLDEILLPIRVHFAEGMPG